MTLPENVVDKRRAPNGLSLSCAATARSEHSLFYTCVQNGTDLAGAQRRRLQRRVRPHRVFTYAVSVMILLNPFLRGYLVSLHCFDCFVEALSSYDLLIFACALGSIEEKI